MKVKKITTITIKEICEAADINRSTFYTHYTDQYDLLRQIEEEALLSFKSMLKKYDYQNSRHEAMNMGEELFTYIAENSNEVQILLSENGDIYFQRKLLGLVRQDHSGEFYAQRGITEEMKAYFFEFIVNGSIGLVQYWLKNNLSIPVRQMAEMLIKLLH
ncbi:MAG: TetR family transcriptional regulator C-terminal domain-containing protein [Treponema sp.]|nr:TetR family transcriptional regulator C-terminal domain-containing protein [Treponema sp.]